MTIQHEIMESTSKAHLEKINKMLMAMAQGNFFYRLERMDANDSMVAISLVLNMLAEEIQETLVHGGFVNTTGVVRHLVQLSFFLDGKGTVKMVNQNACSILAFLRQDIVGINFKNLLDTTSVKMWSNFLAKAQKREFNDTSMELTFVTKDGLLIPNLCHITTNSGNNGTMPNFLVTVVLTAKDSQERDKHDQQAVFMEKFKGGPSVLVSKDLVKARARLSFEDIRKIREGRNIILNNLEADLPSLKDFAHQLGTNEFKLKYGFRELFGTTVYRFLLQERLRKAKMLIQHTDANLKTIAFSVGFKTMPHFSRAFKKNYGYAPSELRKLSIKSL